GKAVVSELDAELMRAPGLRANFQPGESAVIALFLKVKQGLMGALGARFDDFDTADIAIAIEPVFERAGGLVEIAFDDRPGDFPDSASANLLRQPRRRLARTRKQQHARHRLVQPMHDAKKDVPRLLVLLFEVRLDGAVESLFLALEMCARHTARL